MVYNSELQLDLSESIIGILFVDVGQAFLNANGNLEPDEISHQSLRYSPGVGVRYRTPIGPIGADLGLNPDRQDGESLARLYVGIGGAF